MNEIHHALKSLELHINYSPSIQPAIWPAGLASAKLAHDPVAINLATLAEVLGDNGKPWSSSEAG